MEIIIIVLLVILLVILIAFFLWDRFRQERRWREQSDSLFRTVGERIADTTKVFGEVKEGLGELTQKTRVIEEVGKNISSLNEVLRAPKFRGGVGSLCWRGCWKISCRVRITQCNTVSATVTS